MNYLAAVLFAVLSAAAGVWWGLGTGEDRAIAKMARDQAADQQLIDQAADQAARRVAKLIPRHQQAQQIIEREVRENPAFTDCGTGPVSVRAFNSALPGRVRPEPAGPGLVPRTAGDAGRDGAPGLVGVDGDAAGPDVRHVPGGNAR